LKSIRGRLFEIVVPAGFRPASADDLEGEMARMAGGVVLDGPSGVRIAATPLDTKGLRPNESAAACADFAKRLRAVNLRLRARVEALHQTVSYCRLRRATGQRRVVYTVVYRGHRHYLVTCRRRAADDHARKACARVVGSLYPLALAKKVEVILLQDKRCTSCDIPGLVRDLHAIFPRLDLTHVDYASLVGKVFYRGLKLDGLPAVIFRSSVKNARRYRLIRHWVEQRRDFYLLKMPGRFDPNSSK
jgi:hypothetical protein